MNTLSVQPGGAEERRGARPAKQHEARVEAFYSKGAKEWFDFKQGRGEIPHSTWGLWTEGVSNSDEAFLALVHDVVRRGQIGATDTVLDVGCGYGASAIAMHERSGGAHVLGIDLTEAFVVQGERLIEQSGTRGHVEVRRMSATKLEVPDESYTVVTAVDCACHFDSREKFLAEAARVLQPEGRLVMLDLVEADGAGRIRRVLARYLMRSWNVPDANRYDAEGLRERLLRAGFAQVTIEPVTAKLLPGAIAAMRAADFRRGYAKTFGRTSDLVWQFMLACILKIYTWRLGEFVMVSALRACREPASPDKQQEHDD